MLLGLKQSKETHIFDIYLSMVANVGYGDSFKWIQGFDSFLIPSDYLCKLRRHKVLVDFSVCLCNYIVTLIFLGFIR